MFLATIPAVLFVDNFGRKTILIAGGIGMACSHFIVAAITASFSDNWEAHRGAGWAAVVFVWIYAICFGFSWGPVAWIIISEVFPLGMRAKGVSLGGQSNWLNNVGSPGLFSALTFANLEAFHSLAWQWLHRPSLHPANTAHLYVFPLCAGTCGLRFTCAPASVNVTNTRLDFLRSGDDHRLRLRILLRPGDQG